MAFDLIEDCKLLKYYLDKGDDVSYINKCKKIELELRESREKIYIKRQSFGKGIPRVIWKIIFLFLGNEHWGHETVCKTWKQFFDLENPKKIYKKLKSHDNKRRHKLYSCQGNVVHEDYDGYVYHLTDDLNTRRKIGSFPKDFYFTGKEIVYKLPFLNWTFFYFCDIHTLHTTKCSFDSTYNGSFFCKVKNTLFFIYGEKNHSSLDAFQIKNERASLSWQKKIEQKKYPHYVIPFGELGVIIVNGKEIFFISCEGKTHWSLEFDTYAKDADTSCNFIFLHLKDTLMVVDQKGCIINKIEISQTSNIMKFTDFNVVRFFSSNNLSSFGLYFPFLKP